MGGGGRHGLGCRLKIELESSEKVTSNVRCVVDPGFVRIGLVRRKRSGELLGSPWGCIGWSGAPARTRTFFEPAQIAKTNISFHM